MSPDVRWFSSAHVITVLIYPVRSSTASTRVRWRREASPHVACCVCVLLLLTCTHKTPEEDSRVISSCCITKTFYFSVNHPCAVMSRVPYGGVCVRRSDWHWHLEKLIDSGGISRDMATTKPASLLALFLCGTTFCLVRYIHLILGIIIKGNQMVEIYSLIL